VTTTVETKIDRKINVTPWGHGDNDLHVIDTQANESVFSVLTKEESEKIGLALLGENATVITDLPEAKDDGFGYVKAGHYDRSTNTDAETVLKNAKALLAIHKFLVEKEAEAQRIKEAEEAAKAAKRAEDARNWRRDRLVTEIRGFGDYRSSSDIFQKAIDRIIDLETATA
jgi:hypothetical protein